MELVVLIIIVSAVWWLQSLIYKKYAFHALHYTCRFDKGEATAGEQIELIEVVENNKILPLPWFKAEINTSKWLDFPKSEVTDRTRFLASFFTVRSYQKVTRSWKVKCLKRGVFHIEKIILVSSDLLHGTMLSRSAPAGSTVMVLPVPLNLEDAFISLTRPMGERIIRRFILPDPFYIAGVREYTDRDPVSHIHWSATAHEGRIMVYQNDYTASKRQTVILNMQSRESGNKNEVDEERLEMAINVCAGIFADTVEEGMPLRFMSNASPKVCTEEFWGEEHYHSLLQQLACLELKTGTRFPQYLDEIESEVSSSDLAIVTCYLDQAIADFAREKSSAGISVKVFVLSSSLIMPENPGFDVYQIREGMVQ